MKKTCLFFFLSALIFSMSCTKDTNSLLGGASMSCNINGTAWNAITRVSTKQANSFLINGSSLFGNDLLNITVLGISPGSYNLNPLLGQVQASATYTNSISKTDSLYTAFSGTVTLTSVDLVNKKISGTFSFLARNINLATKTISEGTFNNLSYQ